MTRVPSRPGQLALAAALLAGGGTAVGYGLLAQDPPPPAAHRAGSVRRPGPSDPAAAGPTGSPSATSMRAPRPVALRIPAIAVRSRLTAVGQRPDGTLQVPQPGPDYDKPAWFRGSPRPGEVGPAVIEGHVDGKVNGPSVFYELSAMEPGDRVYVRRSDNSVVRFVVTAVRSFPKDRFPTLRVYGNTTAPELRLITCGGPFDENRAVSGYENNTVVFARMTAASAPG